MSQIDPHSLKTKPHFQLLDGLRGVAAIAIVIFHFAEWIITDFSKNFIGHGFLAVDFFFCLSGFVIAYAYDNRLEKLGNWEFFKRRLIRLHPLVILGAVLGLLAFLFDPFSDSSSTYSFGSIALIFICTIFLIPFPAMEERGFNIFGLNAPSWSLFWEYVANIVYVFVLYRLSKKYTAVLLVLAALGLAYTAFSAGNLLGGWNGDTFWHGGARISYSFLAGLFIYRNNWIIKNKLGFLGLSVLLICAFITPHFSFNWLTELLTVLIYFPLLVSLGAGATLSTGNKVCQFLGDISYPLYMTHYWVMWIFGNYFLTRKPDSGELTMIVSIGTILLIAFAYLVMVIYDKPVRKYLSNKK